jgi:hypothetical protein
MSERPVAASACAIGRVDARTPGAWRSSAPMIAYVGRVADPDLFLEPGRQIHERCRAIEHEIDAVAESGFAS